MFVLDENLMVTKLCILYAVFRVFSYTESCCPASTNQDDIHVARWSTLSTLTDIFQCGLTTTTLPLRRRLRNIWRERCLRRKKKRPGIERRQGIDTDTGWHWSPQQQVAPLVAFLGCWSLINNLVKNSLCTHLVWVKVCLVDTITMWSSPHGFLIHSRSGNHLYKCVEILVTGKFLLF